MTDLSWDGQPPDRESKPGHPKVELLRFVSYYLRYLTTGYRLFRL